MRILQVRYHLFFYIFGLSGDNGERQLSDPIVRQGWIGREAGNEAQLKVIMGLCDISCPSRRVLSAARPATLHGPGWRDDYSGGEISQSASGAPLPLIPA